MKTSLKVAAVAVVFLGVTAVGGVYWGTRLNGDPNALAVGSVAPMSTLVAHTGAPALTPSAGLPVLVFYRGHW